LAKTSYAINILLLCLAINFNGVTLGLAGVSMLLFMSLLVKPARGERYLDNNRKTEFISEMCLGRNINRSNHKAYLLLHLSMVGAGANTLLQASITNHLLALLALIILVATLSLLFHLVAQVYALSHNLTYD